MRSLREMIRARRQGRRTDHEQTPAFERHSHLRMRRQDQQRVRRQRSGREEAQGQRGCGSHGGGTLCRPHCPIPACSACPGRPLSPARWPCAHIFVPPPSTHCLLASTVHLALHNSTIRPRGCHLFEAR